MTSGRIVPIAGGATLDKTILAPLHRECNLGGRIGVNRGRVAAQDGLGLKPS
jgi:hypothetical protein